MCFSVWYLCFLPLYRRHQDGPKADVSYSVSVLPDSQCFVLLNAHTLTMFIVSLSDIVYTFSRHPFLSKYGGVDDVWLDGGRLSVIGSSWLLEP
jgi:hypothetical protein